jgi:hypothetical protein
MREQFQPQPVDGVRCVRDQFTEENFLIAVERVDHQVEKLYHLGLKAEGTLFPLYADFFCLYAHPRLQPRCIQLTPVHHRLRI